MANLVPDDWAGRYSRLMAGEVRRYREQRGMSAQQLSDACAQLGYPIHRSVLANFENGRRSILNLAEIFVIACALDVAPIFLMLPLGYEDEVEILPGRTVPTEDAVAWAAGDAGRSWIATDSDFSTATFFQLRQYEVLALEELRQAAELELHIERGRRKVAEEFAEAVRRVRLAELESKRLKDEVERLEQAKQQTPIPGLLSARRRLADHGSTLERLVVEHLAAGEKYLAAEQWQRTGGLEGLRDRLIRVQEEIKRRGRLPFVPVDDLILKMPIDEAQDVR